MREIKKFWYITSINNLVSILKRGILCRSEINKFEIPTTDISNRGVQKRRKEFHQLVPLFFADNTPMLYIMMQEASDAICLLEIDKAVKDLDDVQFSNGNVASQNTKIYNSLDSFTNEEEEIIFSRSPAYRNEWKRIRSAEVLVPTKVKPKFIKSIFVASEVSYVKVINLREQWGINTPKIGINLTEKGISWIPKSCG
jgi:hypothetical protein